MAGRLAPLTSNSAFFSVHGLTDTPPCATESLSHLPLTQHFLYPRHHCTRCVHCLCVHCLHLAPLSAIFPVLLSDFWLVGRRAESEINESLFFPFFFPARHTTILAFALPCSAHHRMAGFRASQPFGGHAHSQLIPTVSDGPLRRCQTRLKLRCLFLNYVPVSPFALELG